MTSFRVMSSTLLPFGENATKSISATCRSLPEDQLATPVPVKERGRGLLFAGASTTLLGMLVPSTATAFLMPYPSAGSGHPPFPRQ